MSDVNNNRNSFIDAVKGIGIISVVIGHASWDINIGPIVIHIGIFVYLFHIALFMFCSGYFIRQDKTDIWFLLSKRVKSLYKPFLIYSFIYVLLFRNLFLEMGLIGGERFDITDTIITLSNVLTFNSVGELLGALWFVPMAFFSVMLFELIIVLTSKINNVTIKEISRVVLSLLVGYIGIIAVENQLGLLCNLQIAYLLVPIVAFGSYFQRFSLEKKLNIVGMFFSFLVLLYITYSDLGMIELSKNQILNRWLFYPVTLCGIYFALSMTKYISKIIFLEKMLAFIGRYSFDIMAMHFLAFKIVDLFACKFTGQMELLSVFPYSYTGLWPIYYIVGIVMPIILKKIFIEFKRMIIHEKSIERI